MKLFSSAFSEQEILNLKKLLQNRAEQRHGRIIPCGSWEKCFTLEGDTLFFWYTTPEDQSTHLVSQVLNHSK